MTLKKYVRCAIVVALAAAPSVAGAQRGDRPSAPQGKPMQGDIVYLEMMLMHHDQGIAMAKAVVEKGQRDDVKAFANKVLTGQQEEKKELESYKSTLAPGLAGTAGSTGFHDMAVMGSMHDVKDMPEMKKGQQDIERLNAASGAEADRLFLASMAQHNQRAIEMSRTAKPTLKDTKVREFADKTVRTQTQGIGEIKTLQVSLSR